VGDPTTVVDVEVAGTDVVVDVEVVDVEVVDVEVVDVEVVDVEVVDVEVVDVEVVDVEVVDVEVVVGAVDVEDGVVVVVVPRRRLGRIRASGFSTCTAAHLTCRPETGPHTGRV
jgi:hypothetical protein